MLFTWLSAAREVGDRQERHAAITITSNLQFGKGVVDKKLFARLK